MEKRRPTFDLTKVKAAFASIDGLAITGSATRTASALGFMPQDIVDVIKGMERSHFQKSMTSFLDHRSWQDVYHVPSPAGVLYVKFRDDAVTEFLLLSFKERDDG